MTDTLILVMTKERVRFGVTYPASPTEYAVSFLRDGKKIVGITLYKNGVEKTTFKVGDIAEYDSYNLRYTGKIEKITEKGVTIVKGQTHRLDLYQFCWRNCDFDLVHVAQENAIAMMNI